MYSQRSTKTVGLVLTALGLASVAHSQDIKVNAMPGTDFSKYHEYKWVAVEGGGHPNQIVDAEIKQSVDAQLAAKGFKKSDSDSAGLFVAYQIAVDQQKQWNAFGTGGGLRFGGVGSATSSTINIGTLVLDMYDPASKQLVWQGSATKTMDPGQSQEKNQKNMDKAMQKLLKDFPPKRK
jgi:hypothetical protein